MIPGEGARISHYPPAFSESRPSFDGGSGVADFGFRLSLDFRRAGFVLLVSGALALSVGLLSGGRVHTQAARPAPTTQAAVVAPPPIVLPVTPAPDIAPAPALAPAPDPANLTSPPLTTNAPPSDAAVAPAPAAAAPASQPAAASIAAPPVDAAVQPAAVVYGPPVPSTAGAPASSAPASAAPASAAGTTAPIYGPPAPTAPASVASASAPAPLAPGAPASVASASTTAPPAPAAPPAFTAVDLTTLEQKIYVEHNAFRAASSVAALQLDPKLVAIARARAQDMATQGYFAHTAPNGDTAFSLLGAAGYAYTVAGENIARNNYPDAQSAVVAMDGFMNSPSHKENVLDPRFHTVGLGVATAADGMKYFVVVFAG